MKPRVDVCPAIGADVALRAAAELSSDRKGVQPSAHAVSASVISEAARMRHCRVRQSRHKMPMHCELADDLQQLATAGKLKNPL